MRGEEEQDSSDSSKLKNYYAQRSLYQQLLAEGVMNIDSRFIKFDMQCTDAAHKKQGGIVVIALQPQKNWLFCKQCNMFWVLS